jgi:hypothetical protein
MGICLSKVSEKQVKRDRLELFQKSIILPLNLVMVQDVQECCAYYKKTYADKSALTSQEFEDVFSPILSNTFEQFDIFEINGIVTTKEILAPLFLFSKGLFDEKLEYLIRVYEKEQGKVTKDDLVELILNTTRGIWKVVSVDAILDV